MNPRRDLFGFDPHELPLAIGTDGAALPPLEAPLLAPEASSKELAARDFDLALEEMLSQECRICPLCGLIVAGGRTGSRAENRPARECHSSRGVCIDWAR
jgi:hypothetical protein